MNKGMLIGTAVMAILALVLVIIGYNRGGGQHIAGLKGGWKMTIEVLPLLVFAFIVAGMAQVLIPQQTIASWVGAESGLRGIFIGCLAGGFTPGGPYVSLPIVAGLLKSGAGIGTTVAYLTAWSLYAFARLPMEIGIMGLRFTLIRMASILIFPPLAGLIAHFLFRKFA